MNVGVLKSLVNCVALLDDDKCAVSFRVLLDDSNESLRATLYAPCSTQYSHAFKLLSSHQELCTFFKRIG